MFKISEMLKLFTLLYYVLYIITLCIVHYYIMYCTLLHYVLYIITLCIVHFLAIVLNNRRCTAHVLK